MLVEDFFVTVYRPLVLISSANVDKFTIYDVCLKYKVYLKLNNKLIMTQEILSHS
jgi:hypothetical protein